MANRQITSSFQQKKRIARTPKQSDDLCKVGIPSTSKTELDKEKRELDFLRQFDMTLEYGPCLGISRKERWERANKHGLNPSLEVLELINKHQDNEAYTQSVWNSYKIL